MREVTAMRSKCTEMKRDSRSTQLEKACIQQRSSSAARNKGGAKQRLWGQNLSWKNAMGWELGDLSSSLWASLEHLWSFGQVLYADRKLRRVRLGRRTGLNKVECLFPQLTLRRMPKQLVSHAFCVRTLKSICQRTPYLWSLVSYL